MILESAKEIYEIQKNALMEKQKWVKIII
jgi:hypothetical protein